MSTPHPHFYFTSSILFVHATVGKPGFRGISMFLVIVFFFSQMLKSLNITTSIVLSKRMLKTVMVNSKELKCYEEFISS